MTESQIFSCPARPNSVNKHFIIWPLWSHFLCFLVAFSFGGRRAALLRAYFQGANDIAPFMWESQWSFERCGFQNTQNWSKFSSFGFNFDIILCEKFTFSLNKHTIQMLGLWTKWCWSYMKRLPKDWKLLSTGRFDHTMRRFFGTELCEACFEPEDSGIKIFWWWILRRLRNQDSLLSRFSFTELMSCKFSALRQWQFLPGASEFVFLHRTVYMWELVLFSNGQSGMEDFPVSLSLIACK